MRRSGSARHSLLALAITVFALFAAPAARAADYTDVWWIPAESGWGVNVVHTDNFMFLTFFIYGKDQNKPTWYSAQLVLDETGAFTGGLYASTGTYFAQPWNPADVGAREQVGNASFRPSTTNTYEATLIYVVEGAPTVTKAVSRLPLTPPIIGGQYTGGISALQTSCNNSGNNGAYKLTYDLQVAQSNAGAATFTFKYASYSCSLSGNLVQHGRQYTMPGAQYKCTNGFSGSADLSEIVATAQGIEGKWTANTGSGCRENAQFSAVLL